MFKKVALSLATVSALSVLVTGASFALFTANTTNQNNTFSAGTVTLGQVTPFSCGVSTSNMAPGDSGSCTVSVSYTGSLDAWVGVDFTTSGALFGGANPMIVNFGAYPQILGKYVLGEFTNGDPASVTVNYSFPLAAGNEYQGESGNINLSFHAVQSKNNTNAANNGPNAWN